MIVMMGMMLMIMRMMMVDDCDDGDDYEDGDNKGNHLVKTGTVTACSTDECGAPS